MVNNLSPILDGISCHADEMGLTIHPPLPLPDYTGCYHNTYTEGLLTLGRDYRFFFSNKINYFCAEPDFIIFKHSFLFYTTFKYSICASYISNG